MDDLSPVSRVDTTCSVGSLFGQAVIPIVNKLQDTFAQLGSDSMIELPQVAVVGSQSSGKSSVLEALVGRDFLPRGSDICTRRPLVLQLVQTARVGGEGEEAAEWGEFLHLTGKKFYDFSKIRTEIQAETEKETGGIKGISEKQIRLKIFSPNVLNITLVDLPGITKVPVGDQPCDIESRIRSMILSYIKHDTCVILAVSPSNADLANSDALQMARLADPDGMRTVGVITKLDIMDRGTDARNFLLGKVIPLRLGYVGVVNRSQEDIFHNRSIKDALANEEDFFRRNDVYHGLSNSCGIPQLAKKLNEILVQHIRTVLPGLKARINDHLTAVYKENAAYDETIQSKAFQEVFLLRIFSKYSEAFSSMLEGKSEPMSTTELSGGARINYIFQSIFVKTLKEVDPCDDLPDEDVQIAIQNASGPKSTLFVPEVPFEVLIRKQIARLLNPSLQCAKFIYDELIKMSHSCLENELQRFPVLRKRIDEVTRNCLRDGLNPSEAMIMHLIEMEMDYINTSHPNFIGGSKAVDLALQEIKTPRKVVPLSKVKDASETYKLQSLEKSQKSRAIFARSYANGVVDDQGFQPVPENDRTAPSGKTARSSWGISSFFSSGENRASSRGISTSKSHDEAIHSIDPTQTLIHLKEPPSILRPSETHTDQEVVEITVMKLLLRSYYDVVRKNIEDLVPKAIMHFLVNNTKRKLHNAFIQKLYRENLFEEMLQEPEEVAIKRKRYRETRRVLQQAVKTLDELPLEVEAVAKVYSLDSDSSVLPRMHGLPSPSLYAASPDYASFCMASSRNPKQRGSSHS